MADRLGERPARYAATPCSAKRWIALDPGRPTRSGAGAVNLAQVRVLVEALDGLPADLGDDLRVKAEAYLVEQAEAFGPRELRRLGRGVLEHLAPEIADEAEYQRLLAEERRARAETRLSFQPRGDGSTDLHARLPDHVASRLRTYLESFTSPRRTPLGDVDALPVARRRGEAFCALLENLPDTGLPSTAVRRPR